MLVFVYVMFDCLLLKRKHDIEQYEKKYQDLQRCDRKNFIIQILLNLKFRTTLAHQKFYINNQVICFYCWCLVYDMHYQYVLSVQKFLKDGYYFHVIKPMHILDSTVKRDALCFLTEYFDLQAEWQPTGSKARLETFNKKEFYLNVYVPYISKVRSKCVSYSYFNQLWCLNFKHVRMTSKQRFSICPKCQKYNEMNFGSR